MCQILMYDKRMTSSPSVGSSFHVRFARWIRRKLDFRKRREIVMDVSGACNLRCPSCPVGNIGYVTPTGLIDLDLFRRIIAKASDEYRIKNVSLFNWGEPLLHPKLSELIRIVKSYGHRCQLSSNLNLLRNIDEVLAARPDYFRI